MFLGREKKKEKFSHSGISSSLVLLPSEAHQWTEPFRVKDFPKDSGCNDQPLEGSPRLQSLPVKKVVLLGKLFPDKAFLFIQQISEHEIWRTEWTCTSEKWLSCIKPSSCLQKSWGQGLSPLTGQIYCQIFKQFQAIGAGKSLLSTPVNFTLANKSHIYSKQQ